MKSLSVAAACLMLVGGSAGQATAPMPTYAIAGVTANMPAPAVEATLRNAGFTKTVNNTELSFREQVELAVANARGLGSKRVWTSNSPSYQKWQKGGQEMSVWFNQAPSGAVVRQVLFELPAAVQSGPKAEAELVKRFGQPTLRAWNKYSGNAVHWCKLKTPKECDYTADNVAMSSTGGSTSIRLNADRRLEIAVAAMVQIEARKHSGGAAF